MKAKILGLLALALLAGPAHAAIVVTMTEAGGDVVMSGGGTANLAGLSFFVSTPIGSFFNPLDAVFAVGPAADTAGAVYEGPFSFPTLGSGTLQFASTGSGDIFGITTGGLLVPDNYVLVRRSPVPARLLMPRSLLSE